MTARRMLFGAGGGPLDPANGTGVLSVGAITSITNDTYYNAWPVACRVGGDVLVGYSKGFTHHQDNVGNMKIKRSSDSGGTWSAEIQGYYDPTPRWSSVFGLTRLSTGRIIATLWRDKYNVTGSGETGITYSDDAGSTWSSWIAVGDGFTQESFGAGAVVELPGGDILIPVEGSNSGDPIANRSCHTLRSTDLGLTWGSEVTVRDYSSDTRPYYETCLMLLDNGELIAIHRAADSAKQHYIQRSTDQGATGGNWQTPTAIFTGWGKPNTIQGSSGTLIAVTRRDTDSSCVAFSSIDRGVNWVGPTVIDATMFEMEYGCPIEVGLGSYLVVYGSQPTSSTTNADIKQAVLTETLA